MRQVIITEISDGRVKIEVVKDNKTVSINFALNIFVAISILHLLFGSSNNNKKSA